MLERYGTKKMDRVWSGENTFLDWLRVEIAVLKARVKIGELAHKIPPGLAKKIKINPKKINRLEKNKTKHNVISFLICVSPQFPKKLRSWLHRGLTSYDIIDTALSLQLRRSVKILIQTITKLMEVIEQKALAYKYVLEIGRTHGIHAEPITFGVKLANWYAELERNRDRLQKLLITVSVGEISGAVGVFTLDPRIEELVCKELKLKPIIATQIIARDIVAEYMSTLGIVAATIGKIANNLKSLAQTEVCEAMEFFSKDQKGSSAMPHKKNPIGFENIWGLMRVVCSNVQVAYENLANCLHERGIDNSGPERVIIPDSSILLDYAMTRLTGLIKNMRVFPDRMMVNLYRTKGLIFSQEVMMLVAEKSGLPREEAHTLVRDVALECWEKNTDFLKTLLANKSIMQFVSKKELEFCFNLKSKLKYVDYIFERVFGDQKIMTEKEK